MVTNNFIDTWPGKGIGPEAMERIGLDVMQHVEPKDSQLIYTQEMVDYRKHFEEWVAELPPGAVVDFPPLP